MSQAFSPVLERIITQIINPLVILLFAVATLIFIWGIYDLYIAKGGEQDRSQGSKHIMAGIIGMVIMIAVFSIMSFALNTVNRLFDSNVEMPSTINR
jgi:hypothetical protein